MRKSTAKAIALQRQRDVFWTAATAFLIGFLVIFMAGARAAVGDAPAALQSDAQADEIITGSIPSGATGATGVRMQFLQVGGPRDGHVKVVLTPDDRALTMEEARSAVRQAFLDTLNDPVFMDDLKIVTIVVHRFPDTVDPSVDIQVRFQAQGKGQWMISGD